MGEDTVNYTSVEQGSNLDYCSNEVKEYVNNILSSDSVHDFTKEIIRKGLKKDSLDAYTDVELAAQTLKFVMLGRIAT